MTRPPPPPLRFSAATRARLEDAADRRAGVFVLEGRKAVRDALGRADLVAHEVWLADDVPQDVADDLRAAAAEAGVRVGVAPARDLSRASDVVTPQGVVAVLADPATSPAEVLRAAGPVVLLDGVQDPGNVGALLRCAAALRFAGALVGAGSADPVGRKALRASAGAALAMPFARGDLEALLAAVRDARRPIWLLDGEGDDVFSVSPAHGASPASSSPASPAAAAALVLAVGSEGRGASPALRAAATRRVTVPIAPIVESLNVAVAFGIVAAHFVRPGAGAR